ncbi:DUF4270 domain-containing protein [Chitinophaga pendula]|uniref:DUF4270 family protein n=1 Tax=Chitinophaga TaxID=79328 RepID=UPI0012FE5D25|nr:MULTISPECIES: DUF4270 family protein [Chitinophaga]UCJ09203.1 DUF4270 domain-containing protein [Chitinophaga pendula]
MKINFRNLGLLAALSAVVYLAPGCNESTILGSELIPGGDFVNGRDTVLTDITSSNIFKVDSSYITGGTFTAKILGSINADPIFGHAQAIVYTQMGLTSPGFSFQGTGQVLDSVVLSIAYQGVYGDSTNQQTFRVYRMNETNFRLDSAYRYFRPLSYDQGQLLGTATASGVSLKDSVSIYNAKQGPQLRIRLNNNFGSDLLKQTSTGAFATDSAFRAYLKGFAIVPDTMNGNNKAMFYMNLAQIESKLTVYYKNSVDDSLVATFPFIGTAAAHSNYYTRNFAGSEAAQYLNTNRPEGDNQLYLLSGPGTFVKLTIPTLQQFPASVINKAELVMTEITTGIGSPNDIYPAPSQLMLYKYATAAQDSILPLRDFGNGQDPYFGGARTEVTNFGGVRVVQYSFNIAHYMQYLLRNQETNYGFRLQVNPSSRLDVRRVKLGGGKLSQYNLKLRIIYTKL